MSTKLTLTITHKHKNDPDSGPEDMDVSAVVETVAGSATCQHELGVIALLKAVVFGWKAGSDIIIIPPDVSEKLTPTLIELGIKSKTQDIEDAGIQVAENALNTGAAIDLEKTPIPEKKHQH